MIRPYANADVKRLAAHRHKYGVRAGQTESDRVADAIRAVPIHFSGSSYYSAGSYAQVEYGQLSTARTLQFGSTIPDGALLIAIIPSFGAGVTFTVTDDVNSGNYTLAGTYVVGDGAGNNRCALFYMINTVDNSQPTVSSLPSGNVYQSIILAAYINLGATPYHSQAKNETESDPPSDTWPTGTVTADSGDLVIAVFAQGTNARSSTVGSPFLQRSTGSPGATGEGFGYADTDATGDMQATFTLSGTVHGVAAIWSFSPPPPAFETGTPDPATVTITGVSPAASGTGTASATAGVAGVTLTGTAPTASGTGTGTAEPGVAAVAVTGTSPATVGGGSQTAAPDAAAVAVTGVSPAGSGTGTASSATPGAVAVTLSGVAPDASGTGAGTVTPAFALVGVDGVSVATTGGDSAGGGWVRSVAGRNRHKRKHGRRAG